MAEFAGPSDPEAQAFLRQLLERSAALRMPELFAEPPATWCTAWRTAPG